MAEPTRPAGHPDPPRCRHGRLPMYGCADCQRERATLPRCGTQIQAFCQREHGHRGAHEAGSLSQHAAHDAAVSALDAVSTMGLECVWSAKASPLKGCDCSSCATIREVRAALKLAGVDHG